ncbi:MAG: division protein CdvB (Snf7/Vps24/ESCRT-III family) [Candidatus Nitrosomirales archaeon]|jgi:division protein CdvB (Snf7/Vps24/ESCRT-III family)
MSSFSKNWTRSDNRGVGEKIKDSVKPQGPLRPRLDSAMNRLQAQTQKMDTMLAKMREKDGTLFKKIVDAMQRHDVDAGRVLSNELAEVRKVTKMLSHARMALEQVHLRLGTVHDVGDAMVALVPAVGALKSVKIGLAKFMPDAESEIGEMTGMLGNLLVDTLQGGNFSFQNDVSSEEVDKILAEASAVAEGSVDSRLPSVPGAEELPRFT